LKTALPIGDRGLHAATGAIQQLNGGANNWSPARVVDDNAAQKRSLGGSLRADAVGLHHEDRDANRQ
jgi:hypothetical protein